MRVFISVDMEGISGLVRWPDVSTKGLDYARGRRFLTADVNAAVTGAFDAGATEVIVEENHGVEDLCNVLMDEIDPRCSVIRGAGRPNSTTMAGLDARCGVVLLIGHHARAGSRPGIMAHTVSYEEFEVVHCNGRPVGEPDLFAIRAAEFGVPIGMVSGDQVVAEQVRAIAPLAEAVIVKHALSNAAAECIPPQRAAMLIQAGAERAVARAMSGALSVYSAEPGPHEIEVTMRKPVAGTLATNLAKLPEFTLSNERTVRTVAGNMDVGFRRIAYLGYATRLATSKY